MKNLITTFSITLIILISSCKKDSNNNNLFGKWKETEYYLSIGGPGFWTPVPPQKNSYVQFNSNGSLSGNVFSEYVRYTIKNSSTIILYDKNNMLENYDYTITNGILEMSPIGPDLCIEGCSIRFKRE